MDLQNIQTLLSELSNYKINTASILAVLIFSILVYFGFYLLFIDENRNYNSKKIYTDVLRLIDDQFDTYEFEKQLEDVGFNKELKSVYKPYQQFRFILFGVILFYLVIKLSHGTLSIKNIVFSIVVFLITIPIIKLGKRHTPFGIIMKYINEENKKKKDAELYGIITQLQNIAITQKDEPTTLTYMLRRIVKFSKKTKPAFIEMLKYIDINEMGKAKENFVKHIGTSLSRDFAHILIELDNIEPKKVIDQLDVLNERILNENKLNKQKNAERFSNIIYLLPTVLVFAILINFIIIIFANVMQFISL